MRAFRCDICKRPARLFWKQDPYDVYGPPQKAAAVCMSIFCDEEMTAEARRYHSWDTWHSITENEYRELLVEMILNA